MEPKITPTSAESPSRLMIWLSVGFLVYILLLGVAVIGEGFKWLTGGAEGAVAIFAFASNPFIGVILGTLATALVQSSSTVTSVIVGMVAGGLPVSIAVPMIMGANMGTTITNTIVSLGDFSERATFKKAFQAATVHDFFNLYSIIIFLPLEILFHPLERMGGVVAQWFAGEADASIQSVNVVGAVTKPVANFLIDIFETLPSATVGAGLVIAAGVGLIFSSVLYLGKLLNAVMTGKARHVFESALGSNRETGVLSGTVVTVLVQSSSTSTSLIVPLAGAGVLTTRQVFPFTMGANIGTCITALLAATAITGANEVLALQIALVHLLYNVFGVLFFLYIPFLYELPIKSAMWLGDRTEANRSWAFGYIFSVFFLIPGTVFGTQYTLNNRAAAMAEVEASQESLQALEREFEENQVIIE